MSADAFVSELMRYVGQRVRISSDAVRWKDDSFAVLKNVTVVDGRVWCHAENGMSWVVTTDGLAVEVEPVVGTRDFDSGVERARAIGAALKRYGPTPAQYRKSCHCPACERALQEAAEAAAAAATDATASITHDPEPPPSADDGTVETSWFGTDDW